MNITVPKSGLTNQNKTEIRIQLINIGIPPNYDWEDLWRQIQEGIDSCDCCGGGGSEEPDCFDQMRECEMNGGTVGNLSWYNFGNPDPQYGHKDKTGEQIFNEIYDFFVSKNIGMCCSKTQVKTNGTLSCNNNVSWGTDVHITVCIPRGVDIGRSGVSNNINHGNGTGLIGELENMGYCWPNHGSGSSSIEFNPIVGGLDPNSNSIKCVCLS